MNLLILTQKVDRHDDLLGFFHRWIEEFAQHAEKVHVICLWEGRHTLPKNVSVHSLGKESGTSKFIQVARLYRYIWNLRNEYDKVFVHMNPEYLVFAGWLWRLWKKRIGLWYTHRQVNIKLRIAHLFAHTIFSASGYSFQLPSEKLHVVGHGIAVEDFKCDNKKSTKDEALIMSVGSLRPIKHQEVLIKAAAILKEKWDKPFSILLVGGKSPGAESFADELHALVDQLGVDDVVAFTGSLPNTALPALYCQADITTNMAPDGGVDKVVLESMATGVPAIVSNRAFEEYFGQYKNLLVFEFGSAEDLADRIMATDVYEKQDALKNFLEKQVQERFSISTLIQTIVEKL